MQKLFVFIGEAREGGMCLSTCLRGPGTANWRGGGIDLGSGRWCAAAGRPFSDRTGGRGPWKRSIYLVTAAVRL